MNDEKLKTIQDLFRELDSDNSGYIDTNELKGKLQKHIDSGLLPSDTVESIFQKLDKNNDGKIVLEEFVAGIQELHGL